MFVMLGGTSCTSKHTTIFALQSLLSLGAAWVTGQERHACDLGHLQACMPAEGITPLPECRACHPVTPGAVRLLHNSTTTACEAETDYHLHWLDVIIAVCMQASAVCPRGLPLCMSHRSHWQEDKHYAMYTTCSLQSPAFSSCARAWKKCHKRHLSRRQRIQATPVLADEQGLTTPSWLLHRRH